MSDSPRSKDTAETRAVRHDFVELWGRLGSFWGIPPTTARVYGWLLSKSQSADAEALMNGLDLSRGAVSMACRELQDWGLVHSERVSGSRRVAYRPETDLEKVMRAIIQNRKRREWDPLLENLQDWIPRLKQDRSQEAQVFRERLTQVEGLVSTADRMAEAFLKGGMLQRFGIKALVAAAGKISRKKGRRS